MKVSEIFRRPIDRRIEEVIHVELDDEATVAGELEDYVATQRIIGSFEEIVEAYQERIDNPTEDVNVWVSGFFGSGKSSFAKVLGYLLGNPSVQGRTAFERFFAHTAFGAQREGRGGERRATPLPCLACSLGLLDGPAAR
jgi:hypothetical protein